MARIENVGVSTTLQVCTMARRCWPRRVLLLCIACKATRCTPTDVQCDVIVIGGSVAGLSAAVTSAKEGARTCLLSPTDMLGGQMTSNGIPALDFATENGRSPFNVSGATPDTLSANQPADFVTLLHSLHGPNYRCGHSSLVLTGCMRP